MDLNDTLTDLRNMVANITSGTLFTERLAAAARGLAERFSEADELLTTARGAVTSADAVSLGKIIDAAHRGVPVARASDDHPDGVIHGIARHLVVDERGGFPGSGDDVRDCLLRVTTRHGWEAFWPVRELLVEHQQATFVLDLGADNDVAECVRLGERVSRQFLVPLSDRVTFTAAMQMSMVCNNFVPQRVADTIGSLFDEAMSVEFGAEGSPVFYITVPFFTGQRLDRSVVGMGRRYSDAERHAYTQRVIDWARSMHADEITVAQYPPTDRPTVGTPGEHPYRIRLWWD
jgi:hypothetical protein